MTLIAIAFDDRTSSATETPVAVTVYDENLNLVSMVIARLGRVQSVSAPEPGLYLVRAALPSGETLEATVRVADEAQATVVAKLEAEERAPTSALAWAYARQSIKRTSGLLRPSSEATSGQVSRSPQTPSGNPDGLFRLLRSPSAAWRLIRDYSNQSIALPADLDDRILFQMDLSGFNPFGTAGRWFPRYLRWRLKTTSAQQPPYRVLTIPPSRQSTMLLVRAEADSPFEAAERAIVNTRLADAEALLAYVQLGQVRAARLLLSELGQAFKPTAMPEGPLKAVIAGYASLRIGHPPTQPWMEELANVFTALPDAAIIYGASLLQGENNSDRRSRSRHYLIEAVHRGIPAFTIGLRLLFDGLRRLSETADRDDAINLALAKVRAVAAYADWDSTTTSFLVPSPSERVIFAPPSKPASADTTVEFPKIRRRFQR
jgi:hypothetical protein